MTAVAGHSRVATEVPAEGISWRKLAWVAWRQQRAIMLLALAVMTGTALILVFSRLAIDHKVARLGPRWWLLDRPAGYYSWTRYLPLILQALPILIGAFVGAPLIAREAESGTFRFAWTQGVGRVRLLTAQLAPVAVILAAAAAGFGLLFDWWFETLVTYFSVTRWSLIAVDLFAPSLIGWMLFSLAFGVLAGAVLRRTVLAMGATMAGYCALAYVTATLLRDHFLAPLSGPLTPAMSAPRSGTSVLSRYFAWPDGRPLTSSELVQNTSWFSAHHILTWSIYQPASRFWPLQWIEFGWLTAVSLLLAAATVLIIRQRAG